MTGNDDDDFLNEAVNITNREIFESAFEDQTEAPAPKEQVTAKAETEAEDRDPEPAEAETEAEEKPKAEDEPERPAEQVAAKEQTDPKPDGKVPPGVLRDARERARKAEAERDAAAAAFQKRLEEIEARNQQELAKITAKLEGFAMARPAVQPDVKPAETQKPPDPLEDPEGFVKWNENRITEATAQVRREAEERYFNASMIRARSTHGDAFNAAFEALKAEAPRSPQILASIRNAPEPGEAMMQWHKQAVAQREIGPDPAAWRKKVEAEIREAVLKDPELRKQLINEARAEASRGDNGKPRTTFNAPPSLSRATGGNTRISDEAATGESNKSYLDYAF